MRLTVFLAILLGALNSLADNKVRTPSSNQKIDFKKDLYLDCASESSPNVSVSFDLKTKNNNRSVDAVYYEKNTRLIRRNMKITEQDSKSLVIEGLLDESRQASSYLIYLDSNRDDTIRGSLLFSVVSSSHNQAYPDIKIGVQDLKCEAKHNPNP